jgi:endonuclease/exonuclease/phosphatase family metal-dependent hydrolase
MSFDSPCETCTERRIQWFFKTIGNRANKQPSQDAFGFQMKHKATITRRRFDHVFASQELNVVRCEYLDEPRSSGLSDHCPMEVEFR